MSAVSSATSAVKRKVSSKAGASKSQTANTTTPKSAAGAHQSHKVSDKPEQNPSRVPSNESAPGWGNDDMDDFSDFSNDDDDDESTQKASATASASVASRASATKATENTVNDPFADFFAGSTTTKSTKTSQPADNHTSANKSSPDDFFADFGSKSAASKSSSSPRANQTSKQKTTDVDRARRKEEQRKRVRLPV